MMIYLAFFSLLNLAACDLNSLLQFAEGGQSPSSSITQQRAPSPNVQRHQSPPAAARRRQSHSPAPIPHSKPAPRQSSYSGFVPGGAVRVAPSRSRSSANHASPSNLRSSAPQFVSQTDSRALEQQLRIANTNVEVMRKAMEESVQREIASQQQIAALTTQLREAQQARNDCSSRVASNNYQDQRVASNNYQDQRVTSNNNYQDHRVASNSYQQTNIQVGAAEAVPGIDLFRRQQEEHKSSAQESFRRQQEEHRKAELFLSSLV